MQPYGAVQVVEWLRATYRPDAQVLPALPIEASAWDGQRRQYVTELLGEQIDPGPPREALDRGVQRRLACESVADRLGGDAQSAK